MCSFLLTGFARFSLLACAAFFSCGKWGLTLVHCCRAQILGAQASVVATCGLWSAGLRSFMVAYVHAHVLTRPLFIGWRTSPGDQDRNILRLLQEAQD